MKSQAPEAKRQSSQPHLRLQHVKPPFWLAGPIPTHLLFPSTLPVQPKSEPKGELITGLLD